MDAPVGFNKSYLVSIPGITRLALIVTQLCALISAAVVAKENSVLEFFSDIKSTRDGTLAMVIIGMVLCLALFIIYIINLYKKFEKPLHIAVIVFDILWSIALFGLAIACAVREDQLRKITFSDKLFNIGSFAAASFFLFVSTILYLVSFVYHLMKLIRPDATRTTTTNNNAFDNGSANANANK